MTVVALVGARGGSKSIPHKNIREFAGHPLIAWSIAAGLLCEAVDRVVVSTDSEEIAEVARRRVVRACGSSHTQTRPANTVRRKK